MDLDEDNDSEDAKLRELELLTSKPADVVKALHARLREEVNSGHGFREVWSKLLADDSSLRAYSHAMSTLATSHWGEEASRISWCVQVCAEYFAPQGALQKLLLKDMRRKDHAMPTLVPLSLLPCKENGVIEVVGKWKERTLTVLDVGSCYNPFLNYDQFQVTAIDIAPANETVLECDFLSVTICDTVPAPSPSLSPSVSCSVTTLLSDSYDVVIFSLLLSFLPLPQQRLQCCCRAHRLLKLHGLLLLITPDSSHQNKHAVMMKTWKTCIESIGFHRWKYWKDSHLHCMAFRKTTRTRQDYSGLEDTCDKLHIPQDEHSQHESNTCHISSQSQHENFLSCLPFYDE